MDSVRIIPLGGLGEVGKNMTVYEHGGEAVVVDAGLAFPRDEHLGVDLVLPDFDYLRSIKVRAIVLTHGHEDHVGSLPYVLREIKVAQVMATRLTLGLIKSKLDEHGLGNSTELREVDPDDPPIQVGPFKLEFVRMAHSIPDNVAVVLDTPAGLIVHTSDYKLDHTPVDGMRTDVGKLAALGNRGVDLVLGDSTNAERPGFTQSERVVGEAFRQIIPLRTGKIFVTSFASNVHRVQQAIDVAIQTNRKVAIVGRSMRKNVNIGRSLGHIDIPEGMLVPPRELDQWADERIVVISTGSQGEPLSALRRMAYRDHPQVELRSGDTVVFSATPIPGNERAVNETIDRLYHIGCKVVTARDAPIHASGHGYQEELKMMLNLTRPKYVMPVHGDFKRMLLHGELAQAVGVPAENIFRVQNGTPLEIDADGARLGEPETAGMVFVDGVDIGDVADVALRDRRMLSGDGILIIVATISDQDGSSVVAPEVLARGVPFLDEGGKIIEELRDAVEDSLDRAADQRVTEIDVLESMLHDDLAAFIYNRLKRRPMVLPVVVEV